MSSLADDHLLLHLVSAPWPRLHQPSPQIGALKIYVDKVLGESVRARTYPSYLYIYTQLLIWTNNSLSEGMVVGKELYYLYLLLRVSLGAELFDLIGDKILLAINEYANKSNQQELDFLGGITRTYIKQEMLPNIEKGKINILGFSLVYDQLYSSIYFIKTIEALRPGERFIYIFGGDSVTDINVIRVLQKFGISGWCFVGQGEKKLEYFLRLIMEHENDYESFLKNTPFPKEAGFFSIDNPPDDLDHLSPKYFARDIVNRDEIGVPDYAEYFNLLEKYCEHEFVENFKNKKVELPLEISRGCLGNCDFCNKRRQSVKYHCKTTSTAFEYILEAVIKYGIAAVVFVDSICVWAQEFAKYALNNSIEISYFQELKVGWDEEDYTMMSLAGLMAVQFGVESLSQPLLDSIGKRTLVIDNLKAMKYSSELGVTTFSNIMVSHPKASVEDVVVTTGMARKVANFTSFSVSHFSYMHNSPIYMGLTSDQQNQLVPFSYEINGVSYALGVDYQCKGKSEITGAVSDAWGEFLLFHEDRAKQDPRMTCTNIAKETVLVEYSRDGAVGNLLIQGIEARVFTEAHKGISCESIATNLALEITVVRDALNFLISKKVVIEASGCYLTIALRNRDVLLANYHRKYNMENYGQ